MPHEIHSLHCTCRRCSSPRAARWQEPPRRSRRNLILAFTAFALGGALALCFA